MSFHSLCLVFVGCILASQLTTHTCLAESRIADQFLQEYPSAAAELISATKRLKGKLISGISDGNSNKITMKGSVTLSVDHGMWKAEGTKEVNGKMVDVALSSGGEKAFLVCKNEGKEDYFIADARRSNDANAIGLYSEMKEFCSVSFAIAGRPIIDIINSPGFKILEASSVEFSGHECVKVSYTSDGSQRGSTATIIFDPSRGWVIRQALVKTNASQGGISDANSVKYSLEYALSTETVVSAIPSRLTIESPYIEGQRVYEFAEIRIEGTPKEEFLMEHYGVSDANWDYDKDVLAGSGKSLVLWLTMLVVIVLACVVARKYRTREISVLSR